MERAPKSTSTAPSLVGRADISLPPQMEKRWAERVRPVLGALGVPKSTELRIVLGDAGKARLWSLKVRRPKQGSVVVPRKSGTNYRCGDATVRLEEGGERNSKDDPVIIKSVYGVSATACAAAPEAKRHVEWEDVPLLAVTNDFLTLVAEVLPGKDAFVAVELWANAAMPVYALAQRPSGYPQEPFIRAFRNLDAGDIELVKICDTCLSSGKVDCKKCGGSGTWKPEGRCRKCGGRGEVECKRCDGTGDFIGKYGDRMGDCNSCGGRGERTCPACDGSGEPPILQCNACSATGKWDCRDCHGTGVLPIRFYSNTGDYWCRSSRIEPSEAGGWDALANQEYNLDQNARLILDRLEAKAQDERDQQEQIRSVQREIAPIENCLNLAMQAQEKPLKLFSFRPVKLGKPEAATQRGKGRLILGFPMPKPPPWADQGQLPFEQGTPVRFASDVKGQTSIELKRQSQKDTVKPVDPVLYGIDVRKDKPILLISFPVDLATKSFGTETFLRPDIIPPAEMAQLKELGRWCAKDMPVFQLSSLAIPHRTGAKRRDPNAVPTSNGAIVGNPRQQEALNWIMSDAPVVLIKGPPGTGKTTVITEAVLQLIARGQKILVCSETHQAVANVLERLHKDRRIRMLRHARQDNDKLTDLERDYLEGGSRQAFLREVRERTGRQTEKHLHRLKKLETLSAALPVALSASEELKNSRDEAAKSIQFAEQQYERRIASLKTEYKDACNQIERHYAVEMAMLRKQHSAAASRRQSLQKKKNRLEKDEGASRSAYQRKTGREPDPAFTGLTPLYKFSFLAPNLFASASLLNERFVKACSGLDATIRDLAEQDRLIAELEKKLSQCEAERDRDLSIAATKERDSAAVASSERVALKEAATSRMQADECSFLQPQDDAAGAWNDVDGLDPIVVADLTPSDWRCTMEKAQATLKRARELHDFCRRWHDATDSAQTTLSKIFWETTDVFLSTCVGLASWRSFAEYFGREGVDVAIIDEAAHVTLTQTLIPMGRARRVILIGDEMQLPPAPPMELEDQCENSCAARCRIATSESLGNKFKSAMSECWLERSAFEWISETRPSIPKVMLNRQFRMHPDIADFVADVFYESELENGVSAVDRELCFGVFGKAVCLIPTTAYKDRFEYIPAGATSYQNPLEVEMTRRVLDQARRHLAIPTSIGVVTPYAAQKEFMRRELSSFYTNGGNLRFQQEDIASVDSFQGSERDVMIASFVRSPRNDPKKCRNCNGTGRVTTITCGECGGSGWKGPKLNWVHDLRRLNVAFSRAKKMLILVGDVEALTNPKYGASAGREVLERFARHVRDRGKVLHVWEDPSHE